MNSPPHKRNGPARGCRLSPSHDLAAVSFRDRENGYSDAAELTTPAIAEAEDDLPDFETGWMHYVEDGKPAGYAAFLRPWHEGWYDLHHFDNWVDAISRALALTKTRPNCVYVGGPNG